MNSITIDKKYMQGLRKAYNKAVKEGKGQFKYNGNDFVTGYAKYFLEYYEPKFGVKTLTVNESN